jgi:hypothetical protein
MTQKHLASCFKIQAAAQGVHLISAASSPDAHSQSGHFLRLSVSIILVQNKTGKAKKSETKEDAPASLYIPGIKIGGHRLTKITSGIKGKSMPIKTETKKPILKDKCCPFQCSFKCECETDRSKKKGTM